MDFAAEGLLDGLDGAERRAREKLLRRLADDGVSVEEMRAAAAEDRLALLAVERVLSGPYTVTEIEQRAELPPGTLVRFQRLLGLPVPADGARLFGEDDLAAARSLKLFLDAGLDEEGIVQMARVLGETMGKLSATTTAVFASAFLQAGDSEFDVAQRFADLAAEMTPAMAPVLVAAYRGQLRDMIRRVGLTQAERETGMVATEQPMAVCFVDLVGFTRLGSEVETDQLGNVAGRFGELASELAQQPVRLVKTIGDAAMFVSRECPELVEAALEMVERAEEADLPSVRAGIAFGLATFRAGDFFGHAVNLASRVTGIARPGSVLCTKEIHDAAGDRFDWSFAGRHRLKGVGEGVPLYRARRLSAAASSSATERTADRRRR
jgi:adenylate cyclase